MYFTLLTPSYNRGGRLPRLFDSLCNQKFNDFEWIVVNDGSTDDTKSVIDKILQKKADFDIIYKEKKNGGKHTAINFGASIARGKFFFIVDSDDYLTNDSLMVLHDYCEQIIGDNRFAGVAGLRGDKSGNAWTHFGIGNSGSKNLDLYTSREYIDATSFEYRYKLEMSGDRAEVVRTDLLKQYPFPVYENERFMSEGMLWSRLAHDGYLFRWFNKVVYITEEYQSDGLTRNLDEVHLRSPKGLMHYDNFLLGCKEIPFKERLKAGVGYYYYGKKGGLTSKELVSNCSDRRLSLPCLALSKLKS